MDPATAMSAAEGVGTALQLVDKLGPTGVLLLAGLVIGSGAGFSVVLLILWAKTMRQTQAILKQYGEHQQEIRQMYENNAALVKSWEKIAESLHVTVVRNTEAMTKLCDLVCTNQFCPNVRLNRQSGQVGA